MGPSHAAETPAGETNANARTRPRAGCASQVYLGVPLDQHAIANLHDCGIHERGNNADVTQMR